MNNKQMQLIEDKYGKLIHKIGHWISGDTAISSHQDNIQDIWIAAIEAIRGYEKKEAQTFEEFWGSKGFDKYIKTCMWNVKNSKGAKITKKFPITRGTVDIIDNEEVLQMEALDSFSVDSKILLEELPRLLSQEHTHIINLIVGDPRYIKPSGKANVSAIAKEMGKSWNETNYLIKEIGERIGNCL
jgi:hypothetical protein